MSERKVQELSLEVLATNVKAEVPVVSVEGAVGVLRGGNVVSVVAGNVGDWNRIAVLVVQLDVVNCTCCMTSGVGDWHVDLGRRSVAEIVHEVAKVDSLDGISVAVAVEIAVFGARDADGIGVVAGGVVGEGGVLPEVDNRRAVGSNSPVVVSMEVERVVVVRTGGSGDEDASERKEEACTGGELELALGVGLYFVGPESDSARVVRGLGRPVGTSVGSIGAAIAFFEVKIRAKVRAEANTQRRVLSNFLKEKTTKKFKKNLEKLWFL